MRHFPSQPQGANLFCEHSLMGSAASVLCFCRQVSRIVITPMTGIRKSCCIINKHNNPILLKGNQGHGHAFHRADHAYVSCPQSTTRWHCGYTLFKVSNGTDIIFSFSHPLLSIPVPFTPYQQPSLTCLRVGRAGWLTGWLGAHGPRL